LQKVVDIVIRAWYTNIRLREKRRKEMSKAEIVDGLKTVPGFGILMAIDSLESEMASIQNDVAYEMMRVRLNEYKAAYNKYWK
jgi:hypothetical protein